MQLSMLRQLLSMKLINDFEYEKMYSMCQSKFEQMAKDAKAIYKVDKLVLVNCDIFEEYLETFRLYV